MHVSGVGGRQLGVGRVVWEGGGGVCWGRCMGGGGVGGGGGPSMPAYKANPHAPPPKR